MNATQTIRDMCPSCKTVHDVDAMETWEGDRYCKPCAEQIRREEAEWRAS